MKYQIPDDLAKQPLYEMSFAIITLDTDEEIVNCVLKIIRAAINNAPRRQRVGWLDPRAGEPTIIVDDLRVLRNEAQREMVFIDYWKGQTIKLLLKIDKEKNEIFLDIANWMDRWDISGVAKKPSFAINALKEVLDEAANIGEITPLEAGKYARI